VSGPMSEVEPSPKIGVGFKFYLVLILQFLFLGFTAKGLFELIQAEQFPKSFQYLFLVFCLFFVVRLMASYLKKSPFFVGAMLSFFFALMAGELGAFFLVAFITFSSVLLGKMIASFSPLEQTELTWPTLFLLGVGTYGILIGLTAQWPIHYPSVYGFLLVLPFFIGRKYFVSLCLSIRNWVQFEESPGRKSLIDILIVSVSLLFIIVSFLPEVGYDALVTHLFVPGHLSLRHCWSFDPARYAFAVMPMLGDWIYSLYFVLAGESGSRLINAGFVLVLARFVFDMVLWAGGDNRGARWAVLLFLSTPLTFIEGNSLFIESMWACFCIAGAFMVFQWGVGKEKKYSKQDLFLASIFFAFALNAKVISVMVIVPLVFLILWRMKSFKFSSQYSFFLLCVLLFLLIGSVPYVRAWFITGNPVFPFFNNVFKSPFFSLDQFNNSLFNHGVSWKTIYQITFKTGNYLEARSGASGFQWILLLTPSLLVLLFQRQKRGLIVFFVGVIAVFLTFFSQSYLRYVFPSFVLLSVVLGVSFTKINDEKALPHSFMLFLLPATFFLNLLFFSAGPYYPKLHLKPFLSREFRKEFLLKNCPVRCAVSFLNEANVFKEPVAVFSSPLIGGINSEVLLSNWYNEKFSFSLHATKNDEELAALLVSEGVGFLILSKDWETPELRSRIENISNELASFSGVSVRSLKSEYRFGKELLKNPSFDEIEGWGLSEGALYNQQSHSVTVSVASPVTQLVLVKPETTYLNEVQARCSSVVGVAGRIQINWFDKDMKFIKPDIDVFSCRPEGGIYKMRVVSPAKARHAIVYATGHTTDFISVDEVSLR